MANTQKTTPSSRVDGVHGAARRFGPNDTGRVRAALKRAHASWRSWQRVADLYGITSKGAAQHIAEGRMTPPDAVVARVNAMHAIMKPIVGAGRALARAERVEPVNRPGAVYDNRGREVKPK